MDSHGKPGNYSMDPAEIAGKVSVIGGMDFSTTELNGCDLDDLNIELAKKTFENLKSSSDDRGENFFDNSPEEILKSLGLISHSGLPNVAGLLLFGKEESLRYRIPNAFVQYQRFGPKGEVLENDQYNGPLIKLMPKLVSLEGFKRKSDEFLYRGQSVTIPEYSEEAIREAIANALSHRDYTYQNSIQIQLYNNELIITSPGGFPRGVSVNKLLSVSPSPRNRRLSEALYRLKLSEGSGRGIDFIYYGQAKYGRPTPDYTASDNDRVSVRIPSGRANLDFCKLALSVNTDLNIKEMLLLNKMFFNKNITLEEAANTLQLPKNHTQEILVSIEQKNLIEHSIKMKTYFLRASISPFARGIIVPKRMSPEQKREYKSRISDILQQRGEQSKDTISDAVGLSIHQCYRLLKELEREGIVFLVKDDKKWMLKR